MTAIVMDVHLHVDIFHCALVLSVWSTEGARHSSEIAAVKSNRPHGSCPSHTRGAQTNSFLE